MYPQRTKTEIYIFAKVLRDMMLQPLGEWEVMVQNELTGENVASQGIEKIKNKILGDVNRGLVWKVLAKEDRYDTPYYNAQLEEMKKVYNGRKQPPLFCFMASF